MPPLTEILATPLNLPEMVVKTVESLYTEATTEIRRDTKIRVTRGVRQGDPLSPYLFNAVLDEAVSELERDAGPDGDLPPIIAFADDAIILAKSPRMLQERLKLFERSLAPTGLRPNAEKCASLTLKVEGKRNKSVMDDRERYNINGKTIPPLGPENNMKYLGVSIGAGVLGTFSTQTTTRTP